MHAVVRRYRVRLGTMEQAARYAEKWFVPSLRQIPGFKSCYFVSDGEGVLSSLSFFETRDAAKAANALATQWFREEWGAYRPLAPEVMGGEVLTQITAERRVIGDRRQLPDRRVSATIGPLPHGRDMREGGDRRTGIDRRAPVFDRRVELRAVS